MAALMRGNRRQSLDRAANHSGLVVVESPTGFRSDEFVDRLVSALGQPAELLDPDDIEGNVVAPSAILHSPLHAGLRGWRETVVRRFEHGRITVLVLPTGVSGDFSSTDPAATVLIDGAALRMTALDIVEMGAQSCGDGVVGAGVADLLEQLSDGWPAWLFACCDLISEEGLEPDQLIGQVGLAPFRRRIAQRMLRPFNRADRYRMAQLAHFDRFSDSAAVAVGGIEFAETVLPHAPGLYRTRAGQLRFVEPMRLELIADYPLDPAAAEALAPVLVADGELLAACRALLDGGLHEQACNLLEALPGKVVDMSDQRELLGVLRVLADRVPDHPGLALKQARIHANLAEISASVESCELAIQASLSSDPVRLEASVELLLHRHRTIGQAEAADALAELRREVGESGPLPTRLREIEAQILGQSKDPLVVQAAADRFVEVASEWEFQQENLRAAKALRALCVGPLVHLGHHREAQERLERASRLALSQTFDYGVTMNLKALFDAQCGDWEACHRSLDQASLIIGESGIRWLDSYRHLALAYEAAAAGSASRVIAAVRTGRDLMGPLMDSDHGVWFNSLSAVLLAETGQYDEARRSLDDVATRASDNPVEYGLAEVIVLARSGRRCDAWDAWRTLDERDIVPNDRRWRVELELARADHLVGVESSVDVSLVHEALERLGLTDLFAVLAPEFAGVPIRRAGIRIEVLGGLRVFGPDGPVDPPEGHVRELVKVLATNGGSASIDTVVDHLWPSVDRDLGVRRLKNVVKKTREFIGAETLVRSGDQVSFGPNVSIDAADFDARIAEMKAHRHSDPSSSRDAAVAAIDLYVGPLLPDDLFVDMFNERRFELSCQASDALLLVQATRQPNAAWLASAMQRVKAS